MGCRGVWDSNPGLRRGTCHRVRYSDWYASQRMEPWNRSTARHRPLARFLPDFSVGELQPELHRSPQQERCGWPRLVSVSEAPAFGRSATVYSSARRQTPHFGSRRHSSHSRNSLRRTSERGTGRPTKNAQAVSRRRGQPWLAVAIVSACRVSCHKVMKRCLVSRAFPAVLCSPRRALGRTTWSTSMERSGPS